MEVVKIRIINLETLISKYFEFNKHEEKFKKFLDKQAEELNKDRTSDSVPDEKQQEVPESKWSTWMWDWRGKKKSNYKRKRENND